MKNSLLKGLMVFLTMVCTGFAYSQDVSGTVSDSSGPLPGASVLVKGTTNGAQTDLDGKYTIKNVGSNAVLVFSYIGLKTQEVNVAGKSTVKVILKEDSSELKEVIVIGYGSVRKKDATGAVDQLSSKNFDNVAAISPAEVLRGKVAGVQVTSSSGEPGAAATIRIRGNTSVRSGNEPLIVVDGVPLGGGAVAAGGFDAGLGSSTPRNPLNFINQNDIESMSVLKDASSTAIYGSRGANGVIIITTKKGKSKEPQFSYGTSFQFSSLSTDLDVLSAGAFASAVKSRDDIEGPLAYAVAIAAGKTVDEAKAAEAGTRYDKLGRSYNWKDAIMQNGTTISHDISYSNSTDKSNTRISLGSNNTEGIVKTTGLEKYTASVYNSNDFFKGALKLETRLNYAHLRDRAALITNNTGYIGNVIGAALYWNPTRPIYDENGKYTYVGDDYLNPVELLDSYKDYTNLDKLLGNINMTYKFNSNLKYNFIFGIETSNAARKSQISPGINIKDVAQASLNGSPRRGQAILQNDVKLNKTIEHNLNFNKDFGSNYNVDAIVGYSFYDLNYNGDFTYGKGYDPLQTNLIDNINGGVQTEFRAQSYRGNSQLQSYFARVRNTIMKRLYLDLTYRVDGSTRPGKDEKYGAFPSLGLAYKVIDNKEGIVNDFKVRGVYGTVGNQEFSPNSAVGKVNYGYNGTLNVQNSESPNLKWESTKTIGFGTDFTLFNNKLSGTVDYYKKETKDLIATTSLESPQPGPAIRKFINLPGTLENTGLEVALNYKVINTQDLTWDVSANASFFKNVMKGVGVTYFTGAINGQGLSGAFAQVVTDDKPLYSYYMYEFVGYAADGSSIYKNAVGENTDLSTAAKSILDKQPLPTMTLGFSTSIAYKNVDLSTSFYGSYGHYIYNNTKNALFYKGALGIRNVTSEVANSPQASNDPNSPSTKYLEKGDFLRMGNLTLGYTAKGAFLDNMNIKSARFFVNGSNLLLFTDYTGFDPEVDTNKAIEGVPSAGMDYFSYPRSKTFTFGLNVTF